MGSVIKVGIVGYGNVGRGVEKAIACNSDFELVAIFTRRKTNGQTNPNLINIEEIKNYVDKIDVMLMCGGSAADLPIQVPEVARLFNTVDSFDTHAQIPEHFDNVDKVAQASGKLCLISTGWDPGLFSMMRVLGEAILPIGNSYTFWGKGVSQGHSDAIRQIEGVADARQYTIPIQATLDKVHQGTKESFTPRQMHFRDCYVVAEPGADKEKIRQAIQDMPYYFKEYDTQVTFLDKEQFDREHQAMPHGGRIIRSGETKPQTQQIMELSLKLDSNPEFTASAMVCFARAVYRLANKGQTGAITVFDVPIGALSANDPDKLRRCYL
jgi:diaminopimelate dehydrogenase